jgi:hypothetical protein
VVDGGTQALIAEAHHAAVADALGFLEREVVATRVGAKGPKGGVAQVEVTGVVATGFDHYDSRALVAVGRAVVLDAEPVAAVSIAMPTARYFAQRLPEYDGWLRRAAEAIADALGAD